MAGEVRQGRRADELARPLERRLKSLAELEAHGIVQATRRVQSWRRRMARSTDEVRSPDYSRSTRAMRRGRRQFFGDLLQRVVVEKPSTPPLVLIWSANCRAGTLRIPHLR